MTSEREWTPRRCDDLPDVDFYIFADGHCTMAISDVWVSATFESLDAARSWVDFDAEEAFRALNAATGGKGPLRLGLRERST
jgi:hypothetical protein